jgi:hypothetical protein
MVLKTFKTRVTRPLAFLRLPVVATAAKRPCGEV